MDSQVTVRLAEEHELAQFSAWEHLPEVSQFVAPDSLERHQAVFHDDNVIQLSVHALGTLIGFILLIVDSDQSSIEFRRIVISERGHGYGQAAISAMEDWSQNKYSRVRIWLDVFMNNDRAIHLYRKLGYRQFKQGELHGRALLFMDKELPTRPLA